MTFAAGDAAGKVGQGEEHAVKRADEGDDPAVACVRRMFETFFPRAAGPGDQIQARSSVLSSAIGRGAMPPGFPTSADLIRLLQSEDFSDEDRHAPLRTLEPGTAAGRALRNEIGAFLRGADPGPRVQRIIERVRGLGTWKRACPSDQN